MDITRRPTPRRSTPRSGARRSSIALLVAAVGAALVLPACGASGPQASGPHGDPRTGTAAEIVDRAVRDTIGADRLAADMTARVSGLGMPQEISVDTAIDRPAQRARFDVAGQGQSVRLVVVGDDAYASSSAPAFSEALHGKTWLTGLPSDVVGTWDEADYDPLTDLLYKLTGHGKVTRSGTDDVDGVPVATYEMTVDNGVPDGVPAERHDTVAKLVRSTGEGRMTIDAEVGVDAEGHVRSVRLDAEVRRGSTSTSPIVEDADGSDPFAATVIEFAWDADITTIGEPVEIEAPSPSDTVDLADVPDGEALLATLDIDSSD